MGGWLKRIASVIAVLATSAITLLVVFVYAGVVSSSETVALVGGIIIVVVLVLAGRASNADERRAEERQRRFDDELLWLETEAESLGRERGRDPSRPLELPEHRFGAGVDRRLKRAEQRGYKEGRRDRWMD